MGSCCSIQKVNLNSPTTKVQLSVIHQPNHKSVQSQTTQDAQQTTQKSNNHTITNNNVCNTVELLEYELFQCQSPTKKNISINNEIQSEKMYKESWLCSSCYAMNRLYDTMKIFGMKCAVCDRATYSASTNLVMSYEWDHQICSITNKVDNKLILAPTVNVNNFKFGMKFQQINCKKEGNLLIMGLMHNESGINRNINIEVNLFRLILLIFGNLYNDGWDNNYIIKHSNNSLNIDKHLIYLRRLKGNKGCFVNAFGLREVCSPGRYEWILQINKIRNKGKETDGIGSIIIGVIDGDGVLFNMGASCFCYNDGYGWCSNGYSINYGKYKIFNNKYGYDNNDIIKITVKWTHDDQNNTKCYLLFDEMIGFELDPLKSYKLAISMKTEAHQIKWINFNRYKNYD